MIQVTFDWNSSTWITEVEVKPGEFRELALDDNFTKGVFSLLRHSLELYPIYIETIEFGPVDPNSQEVDRIVDELMQLVVL